jgi:hypothetical protein
MLNLIIKIIFWTICGISVTGNTIENDKKEKQTLRKFILLSCQLLGGAIIIYSIAMSIF